MADDKLDYIIKVSKAVKTDLVHEEGVRFVYIFGLDSASYSVSTLVVFALIVWRNRITIRHNSKN
jgi:hypothetical protein